MSTVLKLGVSPPQSPECMPPTLAPCIGFLFSNKPSFIVVIVTIVPSHLDFLCTSNQAQKELERKLGKANWSWAAVKLILVLEAES